MSAVVDFIKQLQSYEEYAFSWEELLQHSKKPESTLRKELTRLSESNDILNLRKGFYLILSPRYQGFGKLPIQLYVEKLFKCLGKPYYVGLYSAAAFYGAAHQQIQRDYIITRPPALLGIHKNSLSIRFFKTSRWPKQNILQKKSDAGYFQVSSPALTTVDLINYTAQIGGLNRMFTVLEELSEEIQSDDLISLFSWYSHKSVLQRFGFLLEEFLVDDTLTELLYSHLQKEDFYSILLSPKKGSKAGKTGNRWKVDVNLKLEGDL